MLQRIARRFLCASIRFESADPHWRFKPGCAGGRVFQPVARNGGRIAALHGHFLLVSRMLTAHPEDQFEYFSCLPGKRPIHVARPQNAAIAAFLTYVQFALCLVIFAGLN
jgi:hypothetical protein